jgi:hypothetical protein
MTSYIQTRNAFRDVQPAAGTTIPADPATGEVARTVEAKLLPYADVLDFIPVSEHAAIAAGTSTLDVTAYIQAAITAAKRLFFPPGKYKTTDILIVPSNRHLHGAGRGVTTIYNTQTHATLDRRAAFLVGDMHPYVYRSDNPVGNKFATYAINNVTVTSTTARLVTTTTAADAANFAVGDFVSIYSTAGTDQSTNVRFPDYLQHNKVTAVNAGTGAITLDRPHKAAATAMNIAKVGGTDPYMLTSWYMAENVVIEDMTVDAYSLTARGGQWNCRFSKVDLVNSRFLIWTNACVNTTYEKIRGTWIYRGLELKMGCEGVLIDDCTFDHIYSAADEPAGGWDVGEHSHDITVRNSSLYIAPFTPANGTDVCNPVMAQHCGRIRFTGNSIRTYAKADGIFVVAGANAASLQAAYDVTISGNSVLAPASNVERVFYMPGIYTFRATRIIFMGNSGDVTLGTTNRVWDLVCGINISGIANELVSSGAGNIDTGNVTILGCNPLMQWSRIAPVDGGSGTKYPTNTILWNFGAAAGAPIMWINKGTASTPVWKLIASVAA